MLRESLLNSLFTSSIPPTSLTVRVTLLLFFFSSLLSLSCVPSIFLPPILFPHAWLHTCVFVYFIEAPCKHVIGEGWEEGLRACMCNAVYVEPSHLPQKSLQSPGTCSLLLFNTALCKCGCHSWSTSSENGGSLFFWYTVLLKPPLKTKHLDREVTKKTGQWHAARPRYSLVVEYKQQGVLMRRCLIFNKVNFNTTTSRLWFVCVSRVPRGFKGSCISMSSTRSEDM